MILRPLRPTCQYFLKKSEFFSKKHEFFENFMKFFEKMRKNDEKQRQVGKIEIFNFANFCQKWAFFENGIFKVRKTLILAFWRSVGHAMKMSKSTIFDRKMTVWKVYFVTLGPHFKRKRFRHNIVLRFLKNSTKGDSLFWKSEKSRFLEKMRFFDHFLRSFCYHFWSFFKETSRLTFFR